MSKYLCILRPINFDRWFDSSQRRRIQSETAMYVGYWSIAAEWFDKLNWNLHALHSARNTQVKFQFYLIVWLNPTHVLVISIWYRIRFIVWRVIAQWDIKFIELTPCLGINIRHLFTQHKNTYTTITTDNFLFSTLNTNELEQSANTHVHVSVVCPLPRVTKATSKITKTKIELEQREQIYEVNGHWIVIWCVHAYGFICCALRGRHAELLIRLPRFYLLLRAARVPIIKQ